MKSLQLSRIEMMIRENCIFTWTEAFCLDKIKTHVTIGFDQIIAKATTNGQCKINEDHEMAIGNGLYISHYTFDLQLLIILGSST